MTPRALPLLLPLLLSCVASPAASPCLSTAPAAPVSSPLAIAPSATAPSGAAAPTPVGPVLPSRFDLPAIDAYLAALVAAGSYVGLSVAIVRDGAVVLEKGYGQAQLNQRA